MPDFNTTLTQASGITVLRPTAALSISGAGSQMPAAAVAVMERGPVGKSFRVTGKTYKALCGKSLHPTVGDNREWEGMRHIADAVKGVAYIDVVRVVPSDAAYPFLSFMIDGDGGNDEPVVPSTSAYGVDPTVPASSWLTIWPINGDPSVDVKVVIEVVDAAKKEILVAFYDASGSSDVLIGSKIEASLDVTAKNDVGESIYLPSLLEDKGHEYSVVVDPSADLTNVGLLEATFTGGTNGTLSTLVAQDYMDAWDLLDNPSLGWKSGFAAGIYDATVLAHANAICASRLAAFPLDAPPWMTELDAIDWMKANCPYNYEGRAYHYNYYANDEHGGKAAWGVSGRVTALKAACIGRPTKHTAVSGHHFVPAGNDEWGRIARAGVEPVHVKGLATRDEYVAVGLNYIAQGIYIDDCLATSLAKDAFRYEHTSSVLNAMGYDLAAALQGVKFRPEASTGDTLQDLGDDLALRYFNSGALTQPKTIENPFVVEVTQVEDDLWSVIIGLRVGGITRRIAVQFQQLN